MPTYVTRAEFNALVARVAALEHAPPIPSTSGPQAKRICELIEPFGVNTFSSLDEGNVWGSWPADYRPESVLAALDHLRGDSQFLLGVREYHYANRTELQKAWIPQLKAGRPGTDVLACVGAGGGTADAQSLLSLPEVDWLEGLNEPNNDFGSGTIPRDVTMDVQKILWEGATGRRDRLLGPSLVGGMPDPQGWIKPYFGDRLAELQSQLTLGSAHYYPPGCPDLAGSGTSLAEYLAGIKEAYAHDPLVTEYHPSLYNNEGNAPGQPGWRGERDAYYLLLTLFRAGKLGLGGLWWYALFDYGSVYQCGLYPKTGGVGPRPAALAFRTLCNIVSDPGANLRTFTPGQLDFQVSGLDPNNVDLYQSSNGHFFILLWRAAKDFGGTPTPVNIQFGKAPYYLQQHDPRTGTEVPLAGGGTAWQTNLENACRVLTVVP